jgi:gamma-glutamylcysteine synthetase
VARTVPPAATTALQIARQCLDLKRFGAVDRRFIPSVSHVERIPAVSRLARIIAALAIAVPLTAALAGTAAADPVTCTDNVVCAPVTGPLVNGNLLGSLVGSLNL